MGRPKGSVKTGGRKAGTPNKRKVTEVQIGGGLLPLDWMLAVLRDENADIERRDDMAKAAAPYVHAKLVNQHVNGDALVNIVIRDLTSAGRLANQEKVIEHEIEDKNQLLEE